MRRKTVHEPRRVGRQIVGARSSARMSSCLCPSPERQRGYVFGLSEASASERFLITSSLAPGLGQSHRLNRLVTAVLPQRAPGGPAWHPGDATNPVASAHVPQGWRLSPAYPATRPSARRRGRMAAEVAHAAAGELARGRVQVPHARRVVARPAQPPRPVHRDLLQCRHSIGRSPSSKNLGCIPRPARLPPHARLLHSPRAAPAAPGTNRSARARCTSASNCFRISSRGVSSYQFRK